MRWICLLAVICIPVRVVAEPSRSPFEGVCTDDFRRTLTAINGATWEIHLDGTQARLDVRRTVRLIEPNTWGIVFISQPADIDALIEEDGPSQLTMHADRGAASAREPEVRVLGGGDEAELPPLCSWHLITPHAPGPLKLKAKLVPVTDRSKALGERTLNLIVQTRFAGAFRVGIAGIVGAADRKFEGRTSPGTMQAEIVKTSYTPFELVFGYSMFFDGARGRRYLLRDGTDNALASHLGLYLGFGALSTTATSIDFLKSIHLGFEFELTPNLSMVATVVARRIDQLAGDARVGGPAPATIPLEQTYALGGAIIININPGLFRFIKGL
jgi:hypothetical protein